MDHKVSIIIPYSGENGNLKQCVESLILNTPPDMYKIIVVGNNSGRGLEDCFSGTGGNVEIISNKTDAVAPMACNQAAESAGGEYLVFLSSETMPQKGWLQNMLSAAVEDPSAGAVTSKVIGPDGTIVEAGCSYPANGFIRGLGAGQPQKHSRYNYFRRTDFASRYCTLVSRQAWDEIGGLDPNITNYALAILDMGLAMRAGGKSIYYQPLSVIKMQRPFGNKYSENIVLSREALDKLRPEVVEIRTNNNDNNLCKKVLVLGIYLADKPNNADDIVSILSETSLFEVSQRWVALNGGPPTEKVADVTVRSIYKKTPKYQIMNELLESEDLGFYDYVITIDDDIVLPKYFLEQYIALQSELEFSIAQPARTSNSYIDHPVVEQQMGIAARETLFVEIGPLVSFHKSVYEMVFPFDMVSPMGWGYSNVWTYLLGQRGMKMGIIDNTPVDHSMRKPVENYNWHEADKQRSDLLNKHKHVPIGQCLKVLNVVNFK